MKVKLSFGHKAVILSLSKQNIESKTSLTKVVQFGMLFEIFTFLGSMLPQYMALFIRFVRFVSFVCSSKKNLGHF